jgi:hypothetical protein
MNPLEILILSSLLLVSGWLGYLNYRILKISEDILKVTINLDSLTQAIVTNTSMPPDMDTY